MASGNWDENVNRDSFLRSIIYANTKIGKERTESLRKQPYGYVKHEGSDLYWQNLLEDTIKEKCSGAICQYKKWRYKRGEVDG